MESPKIKHTDMKITISMWPVDFKAFQNELDEKNAKGFSSAAVGKMIKRLVVAGYCDVHVDTDHVLEIRIHCAKKRDSNRCIIDNYAKGFYPECQ